MKTGANILIKSKSKRQVGLLRTDSIKNYVIGKVGSYSKGNKTAEIKPAGGPEKFHELSLSRFLTPLMRKGFGALEKPTDIVSKPHKVKK